MALTTEGANRSLDASWGAGHHGDWPATATLRLYDGDPRDEGAELNTADYPGYASASVTNNGTNFPTASDGQKDTPLLTVCTASGDWLAAPAYAGLCDGATLLEVVPLAVDSAEIPAAGGVVKVSLSLFYDEVV